MERRRAAVADVLACISFMLFLQAGVFGVYLSLHQDLCNEHPYGAVACLLLFLVAAAGMMYFMPIADGYKQRINEAHTQALQDDAMRRSRGRS